jgi:hypothetical protein
MCEDGNPRRLGGERCRVAEKRRSAEVPRVSRGKGVVLREKRRIATYEAF